MTIKNTRQIDRGERSVQERGKAPTILKMDTYFGPVKKGRSTVDGIRHMEETAHVFHVVYLYERKMVPSRKDGESAKKKRENEKAYPSHISSLLRSP